MADSSRASNAVVAVVNFYAAELAAAIAERDALAEQLRRQAADARGVGELVQALSEVEPGWAAGGDGPCQAAAKILRRRVKGPARGKPSDG